MGGSSPGEVEIRRALAECMTVVDIDDVMGWPSGTARRRRWRALDRGGLPAADAELGGVAIWFRSTIEYWLTNRAPRRQRDDRPFDDARQPALPTVEDGTQGASAPSADAKDPVEAGDAMELSELRDLQPDRRPQPPADEPDVHDAVASDDGAEAIDGTPDRDEVADSEADGDQADDMEADDREPDDNEPDDNEPYVSEPGDGESGGVESGDVESAGERDETIRTGFELEPGQWVLAEVHGRWREAQVVHRDRATAVVDYNLDGTPRGARRQRIDVHRVRLQPAQS